MKLPDNVRDKLRKLLAFEEGAIKMGSLHEAENAAAKAQAILLKYNLDRSQVDKDIPPFIIKKIWTKDVVKGNEGEWLRRLYQGLCTYNMCDFIILTVTHRKDLEEYALVGSEENIEMVSYLGDQLIPKLRFLATIAWKDYFGPEKKNAFRRGFLSGGAMGIRNKLRTEWEKTQIQSNDIQALIKHNTAALDRYMKDEFPKMKDSFSQGSKAIDGFVRGYKAGNDLSIHKGLNGDKNHINQSLLN